MYVYNEAEMKRQKIHRYIVEQNYERYDQKYFSVSNGVAKLKKGVAVHHIDGNHNNNKVENLEPLTKAEHRSKHNDMTVIVRNAKNGTIASCVNINKYLPKVKVVAESGCIPMFATEGAAGRDLKATTSTTLMPGERAIIKTGVRIELPEGTCAFVMGRSGNTVKRGLTVPLGLIDRDYRGEIGVMLFNLSTDEVTINQGDRIGQLVIVNIPEIELVEADTLTDTDRGTGGYGSTGK